MPFDPKILQQLRDNDPQLTILNYQNAGLADNDIRSLCHALKGNTQLKELILSGNKIGNEGAVTLAKYCSTNITLHTIKLDNNNIGYEGGVAFQICLSCFNRTICSMDISNNNNSWGYNISSEVKIDIHALLEQNHNFAQCLSRLKNNDETLIECNDSLWRSQQCSGWWWWMNDTSIKLLVQVLITNKIVQRLNFSICDIGEDGVKAIAQLLTQNSILFELGIAGPETQYLSRLNDSGVKIAHALSLLNDSGAKIIANALTQNNTLLVLDLSSLNIGDGGAKAIAQALTTNKTIQSITLRYNNISNDGAKAFIKCLENNETITEIGLDHNPGSWNDRHGNNDFKGIRDLLGWNVTQETLNGIEWFFKTQCIQNKAGGSNTVFPLKNWLLFLFIHQRGTESCFCCDCSSRTCFKIYSSSSYKATFGPRTNYKNNHIYFRILTFCKK